MNVMERKRRLTREALSASGTQLDAASAVAELDNEQDDGEATDGMESDEADIFERKRKFEKLLQRFERHREENVLTLKGNDLRYNVYLKKLNKFARKDLGIDVAGYKDYVANLKEFASVRDDLQIYALDNFYPDYQHADEDTGFIQAQSIYCDGTSGKERVALHRKSIMFTIGKMLRSGRSHLTIKDNDAINELKSNFKLYVTNDIVMLDYLRVLNKKYKKENIERVNREKLIKSFMNVTPEIRKKAGVTSQEYDQIVMLMKLDWEIFLPEGKMHPKNYWNPHNDFDAFVDFTRLPKNLNKNVKMLLYRPQVMAKLKKAFDALLAASESEELRRMQEIENWKANKHKTLEHYQRPLPKPQSEIDTINDLISFMNDFFKREDNERAERRKAMRAESKADPQKFREKMTKLRQEEEELYY